MEREQKSVLMADGCEIGFQERREFTSENRAGCQGGLRVLKAVRRRGVEVSDWLRWKYFSSSSRDLFDLGIPA